MQQLENVINGLFAEEKSKLFKIYEDCFSSFESRLQVLIKTNEMCCCTTQGASVLRIVKNLEVEVLTLKQQLWLNHTLQQDLLKELKMINGLQMQHSKQLNFSNDNGTENSVNQQQFVKTESDDDTMKHQSKNTLTNVTLQNQDFSVTSKSVIIQNVSDFEDSFQSRCKNVISEKKSCENKERLPAKTRRMWESDHFLPQQLECAIDNNLKNFSTEECDKISPIIADTSLCASATKVANATNSSDYIKPVNKNNQVIDCGYETLESMEVNNDKDDDDISEELWSSYQPSVCITKIEHVDLPNFQLPARNNISIVANGLEVDNSNINVRAPISAVGSLANFSQPAAPLFSCQQKYPIKGVVRKRCSICIDEVKTTPVPGRSALYEKLSPIKNQCQACGKVICKKHAYQVCSKCRQ